MKTKIILKLMCLPFLMLFYCCQEKEMVLPPTGTVIPEIKVLEVTSITNFSALSKGEILSDGGSEITSIGYCLSESPDPRIMTSVGRNGGEGNKFEITLQNLKGNTTYYLRAYATNIAGTGYSKVLSFVTHYSETLTDIDGNVYGVITVGTKKVMAENLRTTRYSNGDFIPNVEDSSTWSSLSTGARKQIKGNTCYNWFAVNDSRNIAPKGWHVLRDEEAVELITNQTLIFFQQEIFHVLLSYLGSFWTPQTAIYILGPFPLTTTSKISVAPGATSKQTALPVRCVKDY